MNALKQLEALAPCPFCGSKEIRITDHGTIGGGYDHRGERVFTIGCYMCGASFPCMYQKHGRQKLIEKWNTRAEIARARQETGK